MVSIQSNVHLKPKGHQSSHQKGWGREKHQLAQNLAAAEPLLELTLGLGW